MRRSVNGNHPLHALLLSLLLLLSPLALLGGGTVHAASSLAPNSAGSSPVPGELDAWGWNALGQATVPGRHYTAIAAGNSHSLALTNTGTITGFGFNLYGQTDIPTLPAGQNYTAIAAGAFHSLALTSTGDIKAFGYHYNGQLNVPTLPGDQTYTAIAGGNDFSLALTNTGDIKAFGSNSHGQTNVPTLPTGQTYTAIAAGHEHALALTSEGEIKAFGQHHFGQTDVPTLPAGQTYTAIAAGAYHSLALTSEGEVKTFGENSNGQLDVPTLPTGQTYTAIAAGESHSLALTSEGDIEAFGYNGDGQTNVPTLPTGQTYTAVAGGAFHSLALHAPGTSITGTLTGTPKVGETLTAPTAATPASRLTYAWFAEDGAAIAGQTGSTLVITPDLLGAKVTVRVTATPTGAAAESHAPRATTYTSATITQGTQTGTMPTIAGTPVVDGELTAVPHAMTGAEVTYQWQVDDTDVPGATRATFTPRPGDAGKTITVTTTATLNGYHGQTLFSRPTDPVAKASFTRLTVQATGTPKVGHTLTADVDHAPTGTLTYQWNANGDPIDDADTETLDLTPDLAEADVTVTVTVTRDGYTTRTATSDAVTIAKGTQTGSKPTITGTPVVNDTLTAVPHAMTGADITYQWQVDGTPVTGATSNTFTVRPGDVDKTITVTTTATLNGYTDQTLTSAATDPVAKAIQTGTKPTVTGTVKVNEALTATAGDTLPDAVVSWVWKADGAVIPSATSSTLRITPDLAGKRITAVATHTLPGYDDLELASTPTAAVAKAFQTGTKPTITGTPVVNGTLTATSNAMTGAVLSWQWSVDGTPVPGATTDTFTVRPGDAGKTITVTTTATLAGHVDQVLTSAATSPVTPAAFTDTAVTVTGTAQVGQTLTAAATSTPGADSTTYVWKRGSDVVGTQATYTPIKADKNQQLTVTATFTKAGHSTATAATTTPAIATADAPTLTLTPSTTALREGQQVVLTWTSFEATSVTSTWATGPVAPSGTVTLTPTLGRTTYTVTATNANGTTTASATLDVALPPKALTIKATKKVAGGKKFTVKVTGLAAGERFTVKYGKTKITGTANSKGAGKARITAPSKKKTKKTTITVVGSLKDRAGTRPLTLLPNKLVVTTGYRAVRASDLQTVAVTGLTKHEKVTVTYRGAKVAAGRADARGVFTTRIKAGTVWGTDTVTVKALRSKRTGKATFTVGRRCVDGVWTCR